LLVGDIAAKRERSPTVPGRIGDEEDIFAPTRWIVPFVDSLDQRFSISLVTLEANSSISSVEHAGAHVI